MKILTLSLTLASLALVAGCPPAEEGTPDAPPGGEAAQLTQSGWLD